MYSLFPWQVLYHLYPSLSISFCLRTLFLFPFQVRSQPLSHVVVDESSLRNSFVVGDQPLFDFDDTKILVLLFLIKLFSVSGMNLTLKANLSLRTLKNLSSSVRIRIQMEKIRIHMSKMQTEMKWDEWIRITLWWIRITLWWIRISKGKFQIEAADRS